jgi:hypothetical protein
MFRSGTGHWANWPLELVFLTLEAGVGLANRQVRALVLAYNRRQAGKNAWKSLRPGSDTPLWNQLRRELCPHLRRYGAQAHLGRVLGLPRQQINAFVTGGGSMPDAERTLALLVWLRFVRRHARKTRRSAKVSSIK